MCFSERHAAQSHMQTQTHSDTHSAWLANLMDRSIVQPNVIPITIHEAYIWHVFSICSTLIYYCDQVFLQTSESGINETSLDEFRPYLIPVTNCNPAGWVPLIPSASPQTQNPTGLTEESAKQLHNTVDYTKTKSNWITRCTLPVSEQKASNPKQIQTLKKDTGWRL